MTDRTREEQYLLDMRMTAARLFSTPDGQKWLTFLRTTTGHKYPLPMVDLPVAEGARRVVCLHDVFLEDTPPEVFLAYCNNNLASGQFFK